MHSAPPRSNALPDPKGERGRRVFRPTSATTPIRAFLTQKWATESGYRLIKEIWAYGDTWIAVRFCYEYHGEDGQWFRAHGNESWEFDADGYMAVRHASINDVAIDESDRLFLWEHGPRPAGYKGLSALGL